MNTLNEGWIHWNSSVFGIKICQCVENNWKWQSAPWISSCWQPESPVWRILWPGISCCLPLGFALQGTIIREWADVDRMQQAYSEAEGTSCSLRSETGGRNVVWCSRGMKWRGRTELNIKEEDWKGRWNKQRDIDDIRGNRQRGDQDEKSESYIVRRWQITAWDDGAGFKGFIVGNPHWYTSSTAI